MFRLVIFIHLIAAGTLTAYVNFFWQREKQSLSETEGRRICEMFSACDPGKGTNLTAAELANTCSKFVITKCSGAMRCCLDCKLAIYNAVTHSRMTQLKEQPSFLVVAFKDAHYDTIYLAWISVCIYVTVYIILAIVRKTQNGKNEQFRKQNAHRTISVQKRLVVHAFCGLLLIAVAVLLLSTVAYLITYTVKEWEGLKSCQTNLFTVLSWDIVLSLACTDYTLSFVPTFAHGLIWKRGVKNKKILTFLKTVSNKMVNGLGGILIMWWVFLLIYLEGAHKGRWKLSI